MLHYYYAIYYVGKDIHRGLGTLLHMEGYGETRTGKLRREHRGLVVGTWTETGRGRHE